MLSDSENNFSERLSVSYNIFSALYTKVLLQWFLVAQFDQV